MNYVGVDLHKKTIVLCVVDQARQVLKSGRLRCSETEAIRDWFAGLGPSNVLLRPQPATNGSCS